MDGGQPAVNGERLPATPRDAKVGQDAGLTNGHQKPERLVRGLHEAIRGEWELFRSRLDTAAHQQFRRQEELFARCLEELYPYGAPANTSDYHPGEEGAALFQNTDDPLGEGLAAPKLTVGKFSNSMQPPMASGDDHPSPRGTFVGIDSGAANGANKHGSGPSSRQGSHQSLWSNEDKSAPCRYPSNQLSSIGSTTRRNTAEELASKSKNWNNERSLVTKYIQPWFSSCFKWWDQLHEPVRHGSLARFVNGKLFESICASVIIINAAFTCYSTNDEVEYLRGQSPTPFIYSMEIAFLSFYTLELVLKLTVHRLYFFCNHEMRWNIFDFFLVIFSLTDQIITAIAAGSGGTDLTFMRTLRILKMAKVLRGLRVMKVFSELRLMLNSLAGSLSSLFWSIMMLALIFYIFGLVFVQGVGNTMLEVKQGRAELTCWGYDCHLQERDLMKDFGRVEHAIMSLYKASTGGDDWYNIYEVITITGPMYCGLFIFFIAFSQIALLNILTAIFVQNAMKLAEPDKDTQALEKLHNELEEFEALRRIMQQIDANNSGTLSLSEFTNHIRFGKLGAQLAVLGLNIKDAPWFFELVNDQFGNGEEIHIDDFVEGCMQLRGEASCIDTSSVAMQVRALQNAQESVLKSQEDFQRYCAELLAGVAETASLRHISPTPTLEAVPHSSHQEWCPSQWSAAPQADERRSPPLRPATEAHRIVRRGDPAKTTQLEAVASI